MESKSWRQPNGTIHAFTLDINDLTKREIKILLSVQDPDFYNHNGMDLSTPGAGITTITQALVKKLYFDRFKPGIAKLKQTLIAVFALDSLISKDDQLRLFINMAYLGNMNGKTIWGFREATQAYYSKSFKALTEDEYISLVAMLIAPNTFHVVKYPERNSERVSHIKKLVSGEYKPKGLMDIYYGKVNANSNELPTFSKFEKYNNN